MSNQLRWLVFGGDLRLLLNNCTKRERCFRELKIDLIPSQVAHRVGYKSPSIIVFSSTSLSRYLLRSSNLLNHCTKRDGHSSSGINLQASQVHSSRVEDKSPMITFSARCRLLCCHVSGWDRRSLHQADPWTKCVVTSLAEIFEFPYIIPPNESTVPR